jgi:ABC-type branched-subunit amino acid transport system substrate-binding protein
VVVGACSPLRALIRFGAALLALAATLFGAGWSVAPAITTAPGSASPVKVATIGDFQAGGVDNSQWIAAVQRRFDAVNARGGLIGANFQRRPVELLVCNAASDPVQTARCAQQAVDEGALAVVGLSAVYGDRALPILAAAHVPALGVRVNDEAVAASPASFPLASGLEAELLAMPQLLAHEGATKIAVVTSDFGTATDDAVAVIRQGLALTRATLGPVVRVAPGTVDYAAAVAAATEPGVDGIVGFVAGGARGALVQQLRAADYRGRYVTRAPWGSAPNASDPDAASSGTLLVGHFPPPTSRDRGWRRLCHDLGLTIARAATVDEGTVNAWLAAHEFERLSEAIDVTVLKTAVLEPIVYNGGDDNEGLTPPLTSTTDADLRRVFNRAVTFSITRDGARRPLDRRFFDPYTGRFVP